MYILPLNVAGNPMLHIWFNHITLCDNMLHKYALKFKKNSSQPQWLKGLCDMELFSGCQTSGDVQYKSDFLLSKINCSVNKTIITRDISKIGVYPSKIVENADVISAATVVIDTFFRT